LKQVLPTYQKHGIGTFLINFTKEYSRKCGCEKLRLGMINDNLVLKEWYEKNGFSTYCLKQYDNAPFVAGYMEMEL
jgi:GNAT superfamily N-acetyltransferase